MRAVTLALAGALCMFASAQLSAADDTLEAIGEQLAGHNQVCSDFTQSKLLKALTRPLVSKGRLAFVAGNGVLWQVLKPIPARIVIKEDALIRWDENGKAHRSDFGQSAMFGALARVFNAVFSGDFDELQLAFEIETQRLSTGWQLRLTPRDESLRRIVQLVKADGNRFIEGLTIIESRGDSTEIAFENLTAENCRLSAAETRYLAQ